MRRWLFASTALLGAIAAACGSMADSASFEGSRQGGSDAGASPADPSAGSDAPSPDLAPTDNAVILVHAAGMQAFRVCFEAEPDELPAPDAQLMPASNVVGVEVGSAVRLPPRRPGPPGKVYLFEEVAIRTADNVTCGQLLKTTAYAGAKLEMPAPITTSLDEGVHLLVVKGCAPSTTGRPYTKAECGEDYDEGKGNLAIYERTVHGVARSEGTLPAQVLHLSQGIENARAGRELRVSFGDVGTKSATHGASASAPRLHGDPIDLTPMPRLEVGDAGVFANVGFRVSLVAGGDAGAGGDGGAPVVLAQQSLAEIQAMSAPSDLPQSYYAAASNYVLLLLGTPSPKSSDGGVDTDPLRNVHLLAVPVVDRSDDPDPDAGADAGEDAR